MSPSLTYYFSTGSRYSFLSMSQMPLIERRYGVRFDWVPVNGKRIRALRGADPFKGSPQSGQYDWSYRERDAKAWAELYGITFTEPVDVEFDVECLLRGVIAAERQGDIRDYAWALAQEVFAHGTWPLDQSVVERVAAGQQLDMDRFQTDCADPATQRELEDNCAAAVAQGAFGTPSLFVDDELFWGNDRLRLLEYRLAQLATQETDYKIDPVRLDHVVLRSAKPTALVQFYQQVLGATVERTVGDFLWQLRIGESLLDIIKSEQAPADQNMDHFCILVRGFDMQTLCAHLQQFDLQPEPAESIYGAQGYGPSVYVTDPQGNRLELKAAKSV